MILEREDGKEIERQRETKRDISVRQKHLLVTHSPTIYTRARDRTHNLGICPDQELNLQTVDVRDNTPIN